MKLTTMPINTYGLCAGRHPLPVEGYIFSEVQNVLDFHTMNRIAEQFVVDHCNPHITTGCGPSQVDYTDVQVYTGDPLNVVVTGLTACTTAIMWACACYGVQLTLWHYDRETGDYVPQRFDF